MHKLSSESREFTRMKKHELAKLRSWRKNVDSATPNGMHWRMLTISISSYGFYRRAFYCTIKGSINVTIVGLVTLDLWKLNLSLIHWSRTAPAGNLISHFHRIWSQWNRNFLEKYLHNNNNNNNTHYNFP